MKRLKTYIWRFLILSVSVHSMTGCGSGSAQKSGEFWSSGNPVSDSLMRAFDSNLRKSPKAEILLPIIDSLNSLADVSGEPQVRARLMFCKGRVDYGGGHDSIGLIEIKEAIALTDSATYPYDFARFSEPYFAKLYPEPAAQILKLRWNLKAYEAVADSFKVSEAYNKLAVIYSRHLDYVKSAELYTEARRWLTPEQGKLMMLNDYNRVLLYKKENMTDSVTTIFRRLLRNPLRSVRPKLNTLVLVANYEIDGDPELLMEAYRVAAEHARVSPDEDKRIYPARHLMEYYKEKGRRDSAGWYAGVVRGCLDDMQIEDGAIPESLAGYYKWLGKPDSSAYYSAIAAEMNETVSMIEKVNEIQKLKFHEDLAKVEEQLEEEKSAGNMWKWSLGVSLTVIIALIVVLAATRHSRKERESQSNEMADILEEKKRQLALAHMKLAESEGDWNKFTMLFAEVSPRFVQNLTSAYPDLTTGELRLACLVHLGVETKEIARMMSINADSVKKNRQRLRAKLGIESGVQLDTFLRTFDK